VQIDVKATKRALTLIFSQFSDLGGSPSVRVLPSGQGVSVHIEIEDAVKLDPRTHPRFEKDLNYSRRIAEFQGGEIQLNPTLAGGLRFTWFFPQIIERLALDTVEDSSMTQSLIWLIDDEPAVRLTVRRWLINLGYNVETFAEGPVLLEQIKDTQHLPSLIICDADMPAMPGLEVLGHTSKSHPDIKRLLYTAREPNRWVIEAFNRGVIHRFIDKSEGPDALKLCLQELLSFESKKNAQLKDLDELLSQELIELFIQPIFNSKTRKIEAGEALMRSKHPAFRGPLDILDATQLAQRELDLQRLLTKQSRVIREKIDPSIKLFMNIDPVVFSQPDALDDVFSEVYPYANQTVLELTERGQLCGDVWVESVKYLRKRGFEIALDDLGAGYNSLGAVAAVSPEIIKLDISLVSNLHLSAPKREMVRLLSEYATQHDIKTVAEGIELAEEAEICEGLDIRWLQGYHLERPMPFGAFYDKYVNGPKASDD
jgi:EAL domain-containing protein (putative c-di-GMP-specific phosphodiesterase class I)